MGNYKGIKRFHPSMLNADTKPTNKKANIASKKQSIHKKKHWQRRGNRLSRSKPKGRGGLKNGTKRRRADLKKKKAGKKQRMGRNGIKGNKSKRCKGRRTKSKNCRGRRGRQIKHGNKSGRRGRYNRQNSRCKKKGGKKRGTFCRKRKGHKRGGRAGDPEMFFMTVVLF